MQKEVAGPTFLTKERRRAWLWVAVGASLLSVIFAQAQEPKPSSAGNDAKAREEFEKSAGVTRSQPGAVNVKPFIGLAEQGRMLVETGRLGVDTALDMSATVELEEDGSFKPESVKVEWRAGADEEVALLARHLLTAISESKILTMLKGSAKTVRFTARLDRENLALGLKTEFASESEAAQWALGYDSIMLIARKTKAGTDAGRLYEAVKVASDGKMVEVAFEMPKVFAAKMVADMLDKQTPGRQ